MSQDKIKCPKCDHEFALDEAFAHDIEDRLKKDTFHTAASGRLTRILSFLCICPSTYIFTSMGAATGGDLSRFRWRWFIVAKLPLIPSIRAVRACLPIWAMSRRLAA